MKIFSNILSTRLHKPILGARDFIKYIGPGLIVTVGFIDPGTWASNMAAGSDYGYRLLWIVTLSTIMLILLQHNAAHLGIVTGDCLAEAASKHLKPAISRTVLSTAVIASISTAMAEILGGAIALQLLFGLPLKLGAVLVIILVLWMLFSNSYKRLEKWIIGFVSIIGISFIYELIIVHVNWGDAAAGWAINSAMIILAASSFFINNIHVAELGQAQHLLEPILGKGAALVFCIALLFSGISSTTTAGMAGGSIVAGMFKEPYDIKDLHTKIGIAGIMTMAVIVIFLISDPFKGLIYSQMLLSIQLPITIFLQIYLTSAVRVMGKHRNSLLNKITLWTIGVIVSGLNIMLLISLL